MSSNPGGRLRATLRGLAVPPPDSDAELLGRYVASRDEDAFAALVRRHGPMVLGVCRRRLGGGPDAEDAFQVAFMVLARDAKRIGNRESLPGWLYRVAYLVALKASGRKARHPAGPLHEQDVVDRHNPHAEAVAGELRAALDAELNALPGKLRAVLVLCGLEQRTNAEAAKLLGCPTGTVDSRLSAARQKLRDRLARRGFLPATAAALEGLLRPSAVASSVSLMLLDQTVRGAMGYAVAGACAAEPLSTLADGVTPIMGTAKLKLLIAAGMSLALFGTATVGLYHADGQEKAKASTDATRPAESKLPGARPPATKPPAELTGNVAPSQSKTSEDVRALLAKPFKIRGVGSLTLDPLIQQLNAMYSTSGVMIYIDYAAYRRLTPPDLVTPQNFGESRLPSIEIGGLSTGDALNQLLAFLPAPSTIQVRGNQIWIVPVYLQQGAYNVPTEVKAERYYGPPTRFNAANEPLVSALADLQKRTGENIVLDARCAEKAKQPVSGSFTDVRLFTILTVLANMCELKPVFINNVYYITAPENAAKLQAEVNRDLFGEPKPPMPNKRILPGQAG